MKKTRRSLLFLFFKNEICVVFSAAYALKKLYKNNIKPIKYERSPMIIDVMNSKRIRRYYTALLERDAHFEGLFFVGIKTTGIFCRPTCPARKPNFENCIFFHTIEQALTGGFRACLRCTPLAHPGQISPLIQRLMQAIEEHPHKKWGRDDFDKLGCVNKISASI